jgi:hypothetical protein
MQYFYDQQIRKYIQQFMRMFSGFCVDIGKTATGEPIYKTVPVTYGDINRMAAHILKDNSENVLNSTPYISCYISEFRMSADRRRFPQFENKIQVVEKKFDRTTGEYLEEPGDRYQVIQHNPVPYDITMNVDIWTSNTDQKLQLIEQIAVIFNPSVNLRVNNNPIDWSNLTYVEMTSTNWTSRTIPGGADDVIDISTFQFLIPILINPPAKVQKQTLIHTIINRMLTVREDELNYFTLRDQFESQLPSYTIITPENYRVEFRNGVAKLLHRYSNNTDPAPSWSSLLESYGDYRAGISQLRLRRTTDPTDPSEDIVGGFRLHETDSQLLYVDLVQDTVPANTLSDINGVVDPQLNSPGDGELSNAQIGQRYLLLNTVPDDSVWGVQAVENSIIEYTNTGWEVSFDATLGSQSEFVLDISENRQYEWNGSQWQDSYEGIYRAGFWRIYL